MKKRIILIFSVAALVLSGCHDEIENDLNVIERRISSLESACQTLNSNVEAISSLIDKIEDYDFVTSVVTNKNVSGEVTGYTIYFTHSSPITINNGVSAETPTIGVKKNSDGLYYWTVKYPSTDTEYMRASDGSLVAATAVTPLFSIEDGKWKVSYDNGLTWKTGYEGYSFGNATGETPASCLASVIDSTDYIIFNLIDSTSVKIPSWTAYEKLQKDITAANSNYEALLDLYVALHSKDYVKSVTPIVSGSDTLGYELSFAKGNTISFYNGQATNRPLISASQDSDNPSDTAYYWTIKYPGDESAQWLTYSGWKYRADAVDGIVPSLAIDRDTTNSEDPLYYWMVSYDGGNSFRYLMYKGSKVQASVAAAANATDSISVTKDYVYIRYGASAEGYCITRYQDFDVTFSNNQASINMHASDTVTVTCTISGGTKDFSVLPVAADNFQAYASQDVSDAEKWTIKVISPATFTEGISSLSTIISDGKGHMKTYTNKIVYNSNN